MRVYPVQNYCFQNSNSHKSDQCGNRFNYLKCSSNPAFKAGVRDAYLTAYSHGKEILAANADELFSHAAATHMFSQKALKVYSAVYEFKFPMAVLCVQTRNPEQSDVALRKLQSGIKKFKLKKRTLSKAEIASIDEIANSNRDFYERLANA